MSKSIRRATGLAHLDLDRKERLQVFEFAVNLQNGVAKLPLDDRSAHFQKELERATKERDQMRASDPIRVRFVGHYDEAWLAATWWNEAILAVVINVED